MSEEPQLATESTPLLSSSSSSGQTMANLSETSSLKDDDDEAQESVLLQVDDNISGRTSVLDDNRNRKSNKWIIFQKLLGYLIVSIIFCIAFKLVFLPRTSLSRDLKRLHNDKLVKSDLKRIYLSNFKENEEFEERYNKLLKIQTSLPGSNDELQDFIKNELYSMGYEKSKIYMDKHLVNVELPDHTELRLLNDDYEANLDEFGLLSFHPLSINGNVTGSYSFLNYGTLNDFAQIRKSNINVNNTIIIMRSGVIEDWIKIKNAVEQVNAIGCVIFIDDNFDYYKTTDGYEMFPNGPARNNNSVNRNFINGGYGIPSLPISFKEILPILQNNDNLKNGKFPNTNYLIGPSNKNLLQLVNVSKARKVLVKNLILKIPGIYSREVIYIGINLDTINPNNPKSSINILLEILTNYQKLLKLGWKPLREMRFIMFEGNNYNLGSKIFIEKNLKSLNKNGLFYINLENIKGDDLTILSNPLLNKEIFKTLKEISFNESMTLKDYWSIYHKEPELINYNSNEFNFQNIGISSVNFKFDNNQINNGIYHENSIFDNFEYLKQIDKNYELHEIMSKFLGLFILNLNEREIIGMEFGNISKRLYKTIKFISRNKEISDKKIDKKSINLPKQFYKNHKELSLKSLLIELINKTKEFEIWSMEINDFSNSLQNQIIEDHPWFQLWTKIKLLFKIKYFNNNFKKFDKKWVFNNEYHLINLNNEGIISFLPKLIDSIDNKDHLNSIRNCLILHKMVEDAMISINP